MHKNKIALKALIIIASFFVIFISTLNIFLCTKARPILEKEITSILKRKTLIGSLSCFTLSGITIRDAVIYNVTNEHPLYYFKELKIKPSLISLIREKKLKFYCEIFPTPKFRAHIYIVGSYNFKPNDLFLKFRLKDVPYTADFGQVYGTLRLYKKPDLKKDELPTDLLDITFTSPKVLIAIKSQIVNNLGKTEINGKLYSPFIRTDRYQLNNIVSDIVLINDKLYVYHFYSDVDRGVLELDGYANLDSPVVPFAINASLKDIDISEFSKNSSLMNKEVFGILNANIKLKGLIGYTDSMVGKSWVEIKNASLWESTLFKGVADVLLIPDLKNIIFTDAFGAFQLKNSRLYTDNFKLVSNEVELATKGSLGFDSKIDATIKFKFKRELIMSSTWFSKLSSILLESAGWFLGTIKISGDIREPSFTVNPVGIGNIFEKVKKTLEKVKDILK